MKPLCKVCGLDSPASAQLAHTLGAAFFGLVFFPFSPRHLKMDEAKAICTALPKQARTVAVTVDADDAVLDIIMTRVKPKYLQLHGSESPERAAALKQRYGVGIIKAFGIQSQSDLTRTEAFAEIADYFLLDAKPNGALPGGTGHTFDWHLLSDFQTVVPWFLAGGLTPENIAEAVATTHAPMVDVSSSLESSPGVKSPERMRTFFTALKAIP